MRFLSASSNTGNRLTRVGESLAILLIYVGLTIIMTYPAVLFLRRKVLGGPEDNFHFLWELWYVAHALFDLHKSPFFDPDIFVPFGYSLIRNQDLSPGTVLLFSPLTHFFGEVFTYNFLILASFPLTAFGTYLLARELWSNRLAALLAGFVVGFCPYRFTHAMGHLSIVSTEWIPFFFLYLERLISKPSRKDAMLAGVFFGLSAWTTWYYFFMVPIAATFYAVCRIDWKLPRTQLWHLFNFSLISIGVSLVLVLPFLVPYYLATHGGPVDYRGLGESQAFAAALADYAIPSTTHFLWGVKVAHSWRSGPNGLWQSEWQLYLGTVAIILAFAGCFHPRRRVVAALIAMALGCLLFSFGPGIYLTHPAPLSGSTNDVALSPIWAPGRLLRLVPGFNNLRGWARLGFFVELAVGLLAAGGLARLLEWMRERQTHAAGRLAVAATLIGLAVFDFFPRPAGMSPVAPRPVDRWLSSLPGNFAFMEYPIAHHAYGGPAMYSTRLTGKRIIMGNASSPPNFAFWSNLSAFPSPSTLDLLSDWGAKYVLVDENLYRAGSSFWNIYQTWTTLEPAIREIRRLKEVAVLQGVHVYELAGGTDEGRELLANGSFEEGYKTFLPGWTAVGRPTIDRTSKYSASGTTGCVVTAKDFLVSAPVPVEAGRCYRLSVHERAGSNSATLLAQLHWKGGNQEAAPASRLRVDARSTQRWRQSEMTVRAPPDATYTVVRIGAASGEVWVDDLSVKKIPTDCEPLVFATPSRVYVPAGQPGRVAVSWNSCCSSEGRVTLRVDDGSDEVFATGQSGLSFFDGIKSGSRYEFRLYSGQKTAAAPTSKVTAGERSDSIVADPNPVPKGPGLHRTRVSWATVAGSDAQVCVSQDGGPEQLFARGASGSVDAPWIASGRSYEFRLYTSEQPRRLLAKVVVTTVNPDDHNAVH